MRKPRQANASRACDTTRSSWACLNRTRSFNVAEPRQPDWPDTNIWGRVTAGHLAGKQEDTDAGESAPASRLADSSTIIGVREIVREEQLPTVDFLKVDVDGPDLEVLSPHEKCSANGRSWAWGSK